MIDNKFDILRCLASSPHADYLYVQDYLFSDYIIKVCKKGDYTNINDAMDKFAEEQETIIKFESHPFIQKSFGWNPRGTYEKNTTKATIIYSVHEFAYNGSIVKHLGMKGRLTWEVARYYFSQLLSAVEYIHSKEYVHLNICTESIHLDQDFNLKLTDAENAQYSDPVNGRVENKTGVGHYMAPELKDPDWYYYDAYNSDIYSLGIVLFELLSGERAVSGTLSGRFENYKHLEAIDFSDISIGMDIDYSAVQNPEYDYIPSEVKKLLIQMTEQEPLDRPHITDIMRHPWVKAPFSDSIESEVKSEMNWQSNHL
jgi:serine/threonine protein kinase